MTVTIVVPSMVVGIVSPLESLHGLPYEHENHTNHITFVHFALVMLMLLKVI
jgi:hypothetical protein